MAAESVKLDSDFGEMVEKLLVDAPQFRRKPEELAEQDQDDPLHEANYDLRRLSSRRKARTDNPLQEEERKKKKARASSSGASTDMTAAVEAPEGVSRIFAGLPRPEMASCPPGPAGDDGDDDGDEAKAPAPKRQRSDEQPEEKHTKKPRTASSTRMEAPLSIQADVTAVSARLEQGDADVRREDPRNASSSAQAGVVLPPSSDAAMEEGPCLRIHAEDESGAWIEVPRGTPPSLQEPSIRRARTREEVDHQEPFNSLTDEYVFLPHGPYGQPVDIFLPLARGLSLCPGAVLLRREFGSPSTWEIVEVAIREEDGGVRCTLSSCCWVLVGHCRARLKLGVSHLEAKLLSFEWSISVKEVGGFAVRELLKNGRSYNLTVLDRHLKRAEQVRSAVAFPWFCSAFDRSSGHMQGNLELQDTTKSGRTEAVGAYVLPDSCHWPAPEMHPEAHKRIDWPTGAAVISPEDDAPRGMSRLVVGCRPGFTLKVDEAMGAKVCVRAVFDTSLRDGCTVDRLFSDGGSYKVVIRVQGDPTRQKEASFLWQGTAGSYRSFVQVPLLLDLRRGENSLPVEVSLVDQSHPDDVGRPPFHQAYLTWDSGIHHCGGLSAAQLFTQLEVRLRDPHGRGSLGVINMLRAVCRVETEKGHATGWYIGRFKGARCLMTNHHVLGDRMIAERSTATFDLHTGLGGGEPVNVRITPSVLHWTNRDLDACIVAMDAGPIELEGISPMPYVTPSDESSLPVGDPLISFGHPDPKTPMMMSMGKVATLPDGSLSGIATREHWRGYLLDTDAGSSGSPILSSSMKVALLHSRGEYIRRGMETLPDMNFGACIKAIIQKAEEAEEAADLSSPRGGAPLSPPRATEEADEAADLSPPRGGAPLSPPRATAL